MKIKEIRWIKKVGYQIVEVEGWAVCRFENGVYHLIKKF